jgi:hypothetical protein
MGVSGQCHALTTLYSQGKEPQYPLDKRLGGPLSELVCTQRLEEKSFATAGDRTSVTQSIVRHYTDWAPPACPQCSMTCLCSVNAVSSVFVCLFIVGVWFLLYVVRLQSTLILKTIAELSKSLTRKSIWACGLSCVKYGIATAHFMTLWLRTSRR